MYGSAKTRESLLAAYKATNYCVDDATSGPFHFRIGECCPALDRLLSETGFNDWVYITACNPGSRRLSDAENARRMDELEARLHALPCVIYHGRGVGTIGDWPPEPSLLVQGLSENQGLDLGRSFGQAAIVAGRRGEPARLVWVTRRMQ
ncbi:MAG TPA: DUF3293 domain-containing protein [Planctomycetaceae bacterium]|jgi:hypothetical protein